MHPIDQSGIPQEVPLGFSVGRPSESSLEVASKIPSEAEEFLE